MELELRINGVVESVDAAANESLLTMLRREGYCSVKQGCETGECGACTVLVDGVARPSCVMLAAQVGGCTLTTVDGLGTARKLHPLQASFSEVGAVQCGFCTPGMLLSAYALLQYNPSPSESDVRDALSGNLCRCTGYLKPVQAVMRAAAVMRGEAVPPVEYDVVKSENTDAVSTTGKPRGAPPTTISNLTGKMRSMNSNSTTATMTGLRTNGQSQVVGKPVQHIDALKLVTGKSAFADDVNLHGLLYGRVLTSPHAHAVIRAIDVAQALALPGVYTVLTYKDLPRLPYSSVERSPSEEGPHDQYCLDYIVRYVGDRVAVVAAETLEIAEQAISLIRVEYDVMPAVFDPRKASEPEAPQIHPESESYGIRDAAHNIAARIRTEVGDVERGFAESDLVVENEYIVQQVQQAPIENHSVVSYFDEDDYLTVRTGTQAPHHIRRTLATLLGLPLRRIRVVKADVGGGFGLKQEVVLEDLCALLTIATHRPVRLTYSRAEEFRSSRVQHVHIVRVKTGVKNDGTLVANQLALLTSTGAYGTHPLAVQSHVTSQALPLYLCPHMRFVAEVLYTNLPPSGAFRGYGTPQEFFALESHMDEIAKRLGMDALELRRKNWIQAGDEYPLARALHKNLETAPTIESCGLPQCLQVVEEKLRWKEKRGKAGDGRLRRGVGIALALHGSTILESDTGGAVVKLNEDGSFDIFVSGHDDGRGSITLLAQMVAEVLGVPIDYVLLHTSETASLPADVGARATGALYISGGAVTKAAEQVRRQLLVVAGRMLNVMPEVLKINDGVITSPNAQTLTVAQVATHALFVESRHIIVTASWKGQETPTTFAAQGAEVEVDTETGHIRILKAVTAVDAGHIINPMLAEGQVQGSTTQALGGAVCEEMVYDQKGTLLTTNLSDYHIYNALDMPEMQTYLIETDDSSDPLGAKAIAEIPVYAMAPAIANAVADALGVRIRQLPLTPERVLRAIHAQSAKR